MRATAVARIHADVAIFSWLRLQTSALVCNLSQLNIVYLRCVFKVKFKYPPVYD
jgi:hypothetical protein